MTKTRRLERPVTENIQELIIPPEEHWPSKHFTWVKSWASTDVGEGSVIVISIVVVVVVITVVFLGRWIFLLLLCGRWVVNIRVCRGCVRGRRGRRLICCCCWFCGERNTSRYVHDVIWQHYLPKDKRSLQNGAPEWKYIFQLHVYFCCSGF